jgi:hypothetical protein
MMKKYLYKLGVWLVERFGEPIKPQYVPEVDKNIVRAAGEIVARWHAQKASGEYKRHAALAELIKAFPDAEKRALSMAIELAVWGIE